MLIPCVLDSEWAKQRCFLSAGTHPTVQLWYLWCPVSNLKNLHLNRFQQWNEGRIGAGFCHIYHLTNPHYMLTWPSVQSWPLHPLKQQKRCASSELKLKNFQINLNDSTTCTQRYGTRIRKLFVFQWSSAWRYGCSKVDGCPICAISAQPLWMLTCAS